MTHESPKIISRVVGEIVEGRQTSDGGGFKLTRVFSNDLAERLDPFLMLDAFNNDNPEDYIAGFPNHPHRGFETVTYMLAGQMRHRDSAGNEGLIKRGGIQWMTAGRGLVHSEFPEQQEGRLAGFQLWLNLAAADKMQSPAYRDIEGMDIPEFTNSDGVKARVIAGKTHGVEGAISRPKTEPLFLDLHFNDAGQFIQTIPNHYTAFLYVYSGNVQVGDITIDERTMAILDSNSESEGVQIVARQNARALLIAAQPLHEPIAQYGPFVMNTQAELHQAVRDYQAGLFE